MAQISFANTQQSENTSKIVDLLIYYNKTTAAYFTSDEPGGIENATHNTFPKLTSLF
jgi:hypothetical protein